MSDYLVFLLADTDRIFVLYALLCTYVCSVWCIMCICMYVRLVLHRAGCLKRGIKYIKYFVLARCNAMQLQDLYPIDTVP